MGVRESYDAVAAEYAAKFLSELDHKPLDRALLAYFAEQTSGKIIDVGCGPGQVARFLSGRGADVEGLDFSPAMIDEARRRHPGMKFRVADMARLPFADGELAGIAAFYAIVNTPPDELIGPLREFRRVLRAGGLAILSFHIGTETRHLDEFLGKPVSIDFFFFPRELVEARLVEAGFTIEARLEREPIKDVEYPSRRAYLIARK